MKFKIIKNLHFVHNSYMLIVPRRWLDIMGFKKEDKVDVIYDSLNEQIVIRKSNTIEE